MKKYLFFFLFVFLFINKVDAKEYIININDNESIVLNGNDDYYNENISYIKNENKIILDNAHIKNFIINGEEKDTLTIELIGDSYIENSNTYGIENYYSDLIIEGSGNLNIKTESYICNALYMENSNIYIRSKVILESFASNTIYLKYGELIIESSGYVSVRSEKAQGIFLEYGLLEVNNSTLKVNSTVNSIVIRNYYKSYYFINSKINSDSNLEKNFKFQDYYTYIIGISDNLEILPDAIEQEKYKLKVINNTGGEIILNKTMYQEGERIDYEIKPNIHYLYVSDSLSTLEDINKINSNSKIRMIKDGLTISSEFREMEKYEIRLNYNEGGTFDKDAITYVYDGEDYIVNININDNYQIKNIYVNDNSIDINTQIEIKDIHSNCVISIEFEKIYNNVIINENEVINNPNTNDNIYIYKLALFITIAIIIEIFIIKLLKV